MNNEIKLDNIEVSSEETSQKKEFLVQTEFLSEHKNDAVSIEIVELTDKQKKAKLDCEETEKRYAALNEYISKLKDTNDYSDSYNIKIEKFEGPIHLLLQLVKLAKIKIQDIFISKITEQYLSYMEQIDRLDMEKAAGFIEIATILIEIKSKSLLPLNPEEIEDNSAKKELIQRIEEYKIYKEASEKMKESETVGIYFKEPDNTVGDPRIVLKDMTMDGLTKALQKLFLKLEKQAIVAPQRKITLDRFTVADKISHIKDTMLFREEISFFELFEADYSRSEIITTFQALLELLKLQFAKARQEELFGNIQIYRNTEQAS